MKNKNLTLNEKVLIAISIITAGDINKKFTAEDIIIKAWEEDKGAFGLRGYEKDHPDSNILYTKLMGKSGLVRLGYLKKVGDKTYTLTEAGASISARLSPKNEDLQLKANRGLQEAIIKILNHPIFQDWKIDKNKPKSFRDAGWFWGIAPGTPPKVVSERLKYVEQTLFEARSILKEKKSKEIIEERGKILFNGKDLDLCEKFHNTLKERFKKEIGILLEN